MAVLRSADIAPQVPKVWSTELWYEAEHQTFWNGFEGSQGSSMPVIRKENLIKEVGDTVYFDLVLSLTGSGQNSDTVLLEGNEEKLKFRQTSVGLAILKHAVRQSWYADLIMQHDAREAGKKQLAKWLARRLDDRIFGELTGNQIYTNDPTPTTVPTKNKWAAGTATTRNTVDDTDAGGRLTLDDLTRIKAYAQTELKVEPIRIDGDYNEYFGLVVHPYAAMSLKVNDTKWAQAQREAQERGPGNPLFTGSVGMWDGVIIYTSPRVPRSLNTVPIQVSDNVFFGAQALSRAYAYYPDWVEQDFSYEEERGFATKVVLGHKINVFDLTAAGGAAAADLTWIGGMVVYTAAVAPGQP